MLAYVGGDPAAFDEIYRRYAKRVYGFFRRALSERETAEDLLQQTFLRVHRGRDTYRPGHALGGWIFRIAYNLFRDELRRRGRRPLELVDDAARLEAMASTSPVESPDPRAERLRVALEELPEAQREAVLLCKYMELTHEEAARLVECTPDAMKLRVFRGLQTLRARLLPAAASVRAR